MKYSLRTENKQIVLTFLVCTLAFLFIKSAEGKSFDPKFLKLNTDEQWLFERNDGQLADEFGIQRPEFLYFGGTQNVKVLCRKNKIVFSFIKYDNQSPVSEATGHKPFAVTETVELPKSRAIQSTKAELIFENANKDVQVQGEDKQEFYKNYYLSHTGIGGITHVPTFTQVIYKNIYRNIDLVLEVRKTGLKYSFVLHPGAKASNIKLHWTNLNNNLDADGNLIYKGSLYEMRESAPQSFYQSGKHKIYSTFTKTGQDIQFDMGKYDVSQTVIIDPELDWITYDGGNGTDNSTDMETDNDNNIYATGNTDSYSGFISSSKSGGTDAFIVKFSYTGQRLWATYYGGTSNDYGNGLAIDGNFFYLSGTTSSTSAIATSGTYQSSFPSGQTVAGFLVKFTKDGTRKWGTYFGPNSQDVAVDKYSNVYPIDNYSCWKFDSSGMFIKKFKSHSGYYYRSVTITNKNQVALAGSVELLTATKSSYGAILRVYDTALALKWDGGIASWESGASSVTSDSFGNIYVAGSCSSDTTYTYYTKGACDTILTGGNDAFVEKFDSKGKRIWGTLYGGSGQDRITSVSVSKPGSIFIFGNTNSSSGMATPDAISTKLQGNYDCFIAILDSDAKSIHYASYIGGNNDDEPSTIKIDASGQVVFFGNTESTKYLATSNAYKKTGPRVPDLFLGRFYGLEGCKGGKYYVGKGQKYPTLDSFMNDLVRTGFCDPITVYLTDTSYDYTFHLKYIKNLSSYATLTFEAQSSTAKIYSTASSASNDNFTLYLDSVSNVTFKNITFERRGSGTYSTVGILRKCSDINFYNCAFNGYGDTSLVSQANLVLDSGNTRILLSGNTFNGGSYALYIPYPSRYISIINNAIYDPYFIGIYTDVMPGLKLTGNDIGSFSQKNGSCVYFNRLQNDSLMFYGNSLSVRSEGYGLHFSTSDTLTIRKLFFRESSFYVSDNSGKAAALLVDGISCDALTFDSSSITVEYGGNGFVLQNIKGKNVSLDIKNNTFSITDTLHRNSVFNISGLAGLNRPHLFLENNNFNRSGPVKGFYLDTKSLPDSLFLKATNNKFTASDKMSYLESDLTINEIQKGKISFLRNRFYHSNGGKCLVFSSTSSNKAGEINFINNYFSLQAKDTSSALDISARADLQFYYNTINCFQNDSAVKLMKLDLKDKSSKAILYNNLFSNSSGGIDFDFPTTFNLISDNNDYYHPKGNIASWGKMQLNDVAAMVKTTGTDTNSLEENPYFIGSGYIPASPYINRKGRILSEVTTDINGAVRDSLKPDIGVVEFNTETNEAGLFHLKGLSQPADCGGIKDLYVDIRNEASADLTVLSLRWTLNGVLQNSAVWKGRLAWDSTYRNFKFGSYNFGKDSIVNIKLWVSLPNGVQDSFPYDDTLVFQTKIHPLPLAVTGTSQTICEGESVKLGANNIAGHAYYWSSSDSGFSDTSSSISVNPKHTTTYYLKETILATGCNKSDSVTITVQAKPSPSLSGPTLFCIGGQGIYSTAAVSGNKYSWTVKGGGFASGRYSNSVTIFWNKAGIDTLKVFETSPNGCKDSSFIAVEVEGKPKASFSVSENCAGKPVVFTDTSEGSIVSRKWYFSDGRTDTTNNPSLIINSAGSYTASLVVKTKAGCKDSGWRSFQVYPLPLANFSAAAVCLWDSMAFSNLSNGADSYLWNFGDGDSSRLSDPVHFYAKPGKYPVHLTAVSKEGCSDETIDTVEVHDLPVISWTAEKDSSGRGFSFKASSMTLTSYSWDFGDGNTGSGSETKHTYSADGTYEVGLTATDSLGCDASYSSTVEAKEVKDTSSDTTAIYLSQKFPYQCRIFPNPTNGKVTFEYSLPSPSKVKVQLMTIDGKVFSLYNNQLQNAGKHAIDSDLGKLGLKAGMYCIHIFVGDNHFTGYVVLQE